MRTMIFDIDKTLLTGSHCHFYSFKQAFRDLFDVEIEIDIGSIQGMTDREIIFRTARRYGLEIDDGVFSEIVDSISCHYLENLERDRITPLEGAGVVLEKLHEMNVPLGVVTGNIEPVAWLKLQQAGFSEYFSYGGFGNEGCRRSSIIRVALERLAAREGPVNPSETFIVGDTPRDIAGGREAGLRTIGVATGDFTCAELKSAGADHVLEGLHDVEGFFEIISAYGAGVSL
ncbi:MULTISPECIES: HAD family hydrolase [Methanothermobacter]|uniref:HAD family hydrolase n=1 Tax=Methanothermobacter wolfeii TaxID=145261 RepID=A0A9E7RUH6_METWO|nr:HAD family hydrolase [Methanothermobacter wolfeii]UXH32041.1 HAD family hydrolase [Methanothermobacter wolfeii]